MDKSILTVGKTEWNELSSKVSAEGTVLLKNDNNVLPIGDEKIAVFGRTQINTMGYGDCMSFAEGFAKQGIAVDNELTIAFMGGSVTNGMGSSKGTKGYRGRLLKNLSTAYNATFMETDESLGGNGSQYGVYITEQYVASKKPDIVFIEYAVNNAFDGVKDADKLWNHYETMIHMIRKANPYADIVLLYVSNRGNASKDVIPIVEQVADKYQLMSVNLYEAINYQIQAKGGKWEDYYSDDVHGADNGYDVMADALTGAIQYAFTTDAYKTYAKMSTPTPKTAIQSEAKMVLTSSLEKVPAGWSYNKKFSYTTKYKGCITTTTGDSVTVKFKGTHFGLLLEFAEDAGTLEYRIDGGVAKTLSCSLNYSNPKVELLMENASNTEHAVTFRLQPGANKRMAVAAFMINGNIISVQ